MPIDYTGFQTPRADLGVALREYVPELPLVAEEVLPGYLVGKKAASISVITRENLKRTTAGHANGAAFNRIRLLAEDMSYTCKDYGLEEQLTQDDRETYASDFDAELEKSQNAKQHVLVEQEVRTAAAVFNTTTWTGSALFTDNSGSPWATSSTDIIAQVLAGKEKVRAGTGAKADSLLLSESNMTNLLKNTGIKAMFPGAAIITEEMLRSAMAAIFGLRNLIVGGAVYDSAAEGQDFSGTDIWSASYVMVFKRCVGPVSSGGLGRTLQWSEINDSNIIVTYPEPQTDSDIYRYRQYQDEKIFDASFGHLMQVA